MDWLDAFFQKLQEEYMDAMSKAIAEGKVAVLVEDGKVVAAYGPKEFFSGFDTTVSFEKRSD